jgi:DNA-directed RNA polymerase subunit RPC12/RpoP
MDATGHRYMLRATEQLDQNGDNMKTLSQYNEEYKIRFNRENENNIGIACDTCGNELKGEKSLLMSNPPRQNIRCPNCGWKGRRFV